MYMRSDGKEILIANPTTTGGVMAIYRDSNTTNATFAVSIDSISAHSFDDNYKGFNVSKDRIMLLSNRQWRTSCSNLQPDGVSTSQYSTNINLTASIDNGATLLVRIQQYDSDVKYNQALNVDFISKRSAMKISLHIIGDPFAHLDPGLSIFDSFD